MPLIRKRSRRRKNIFLGICIGGMPFFILSVILSCILYTHERQLKGYKKYTAEIKEAYILKRTLSAGEQIQEGDVKKVCLSGMDADNYRIMERRELIGKRCMTDISQGTILCEELLYEGEVITEDVREYCCMGVTVHGTVKEGDFADIRICFPNGEDYIVVKHKKILKAENEEDAKVNLTFQVSEEELLRLDSAKIDTVLYKGTCIYALSYLNWSQHGADITYPVNEDVFSLMSRNPNMKDYHASEQEQEYRRILELHLEEWQNEEVFFP